MLWSDRLSHSTVSRAVLSGGHERLHDNDDNDNDNQDAPGHRGDLHERLLRRQQ